MTFCPDDVAAEFDRQTQTVFDRRLLSRRSRAESPYRLGWLPTPQRALKQQYPTWMYAWWGVKRARAVSAVLEALQGVTWS